VIDLLKWPHTAALDWVEIPEDGPAWTYSRTVRPAPTIPVTAETCVRHCPANLWAVDRRERLAKVLQVPHVEWFRRGGLVGAFARGAGVCRDRRFP